MRHREWSISANLQFYDVTQDPGYLQEAQRIAARSLTRFFDAGTGRINDEGYWAFELVDALVDVYERDQDPQWLDAVAGALDWLHANKQDPEGHYGRFWGREGAQNTTLSQWELNDQSSVARAYLHLGLSSEPVDTLVGDFNNDGQVDAADYTTWRDALGENAALPHDGGLGSPIGAEHYQLWRFNYGAAESLPNAVAAPEPTPLGMVLLGCAMGSCLIARQGREEYRRDGRMPSAFRGRQSHVKQPECKATREARQ